jgi:hypothetical protein
MTATSLLEALHGLGVTARVEGGAVKLHPGRLIDAQLLEEVRRDALSPRYFGPIPTRLRRSGKQSNRTNLAQVSQRANYALATRNSVKTEESDLFDRVNGRALVSRKTWPQSNAQPKKSFGY